MLQNPKRHSAVECGGNRFHSRLNRPDTTAEKDTFLFEIF